MQNSAISFSVVTDYHPTHLDELINELRQDFEILYNTGLRLITIKNYTAEKYDEYSNSSNILLEQVSRNNYRLLVAP